MEKQLMLGTQLKNLRKQRKLSQERISNQLGILRQTYSTYETGRIVPPTDILLALSKLYEVPFESFFEACEEIKPINNGSLPKFAAATLLFDSESIAAESELINLFRSIDLRDQRDIIEFLRLKARQYRNRIRTDIDN